MLSVQAIASRLLSLCCLAMWTNMHGVLVCRYAPLSIDFPSAVAALRQLAMKVQPHVDCHLAKLTLPEDLDLLRRSVCMVPSATDCKARIVAVPPYRTTRSGLRCQWLSSAGHCQQTVHRAMRTSACSMTLAQPQPGRCATPVLCPLQ